MQAAGSQYSRHAGGRRPTHGMQYGKVEHEGERGFARNACRQRHAWLQPLAQRLKLCLPRRGDVMNGSICSKDTAEQLCHLPAVTSGQHLGGEQARMQESGP